MRLIDADILVQDTIQEYARSKQYRDAIIRMVNKAPTIEPKRGGWESWWNEDLSRWGARCTSCHKWSSAYFNFCPNCGARMKGKDNE